MSAGGWIRPCHRWTAIVFTLTVLANFVTRALQGGEPPAWITYAPLPALFLLLLTGLTMFVQPYIARRRSGKIPLHA